MTDERRHPSLLEDIIREILITHGLPWARDILTGRREEQIKKKGNKTTFGEAMAKLKASDPGAHDKILDFVGDHLKGRPADQEDFEVNSARTGPTVQETVDFLKLVASLSDHDAREVFLNAIGYIGARSVDIKERALKLASDLKKWVGKQGGAVKKGVETLGKTAADEIAKLEARAVKSSPKISDARKKAEDNFRRTLDKFRR